MEGLLGGFYEAGKQALEAELEGPNANLLREALTGFQQTGQRVDAGLRAALQAIQEQRQALTQLTEELSTLQSRQELEFRELLERNKKAEEQSAERTAWEKRHNELMLKKRRLDAIRAELEQLLASRQELLDQLQQLQHDRFELRQQIVDRINRQLTSQRIRVRILHNGYVAPLRELLEEVLRPCGIQHRIVADKLANRLEPAELVAIVTEGAEEKLMELADLNANQARAVMRAMADSQALLQVETVELLDLPHIELLHGTIYKDSLQLSTGQKCTAVLPILLLDSTNPLLIDQPEDNLDNAFIYATVVRALQEIKSRRQIVFVTHNANIPVLGDAQRMFVLESDGAKARIANQGDIFDCRDDILSLLEGGEEAYRERGRRYHHDRHRKTQTG